MAVYLITLHGYRTWSPRNRRGFVQRGEGIQPPNDALAQSYDDRAKSEPVLFDESLQRVLVWGVYDICGRRDWRLHVVTTEPTHVHFLLSWKEFVDWRDVRRIAKNILSLLLGRFTGRQGGKWFVEDGSRKWVRDRNHFEFLKTEYLPRHKGVSWYEGWPAPEQPAGVEPPQEPPASAGG